MIFGLIFGPGIQPLSGDPITVSMAGLTGGEARPGDHAGITLVPSEGTVTARRWGSTVAGSEFGTGTSPTDYTSADGGVLYGAVTIDGTEYQTSANIRYAAGTAANALPDREHTNGDTITPYSVASDFSGTGLTFTYSATGLAASLSMASNGQVSGTLTALLSSTAVVVTATDQYGGTITSGYSNSVIAPGSTPTLDSLSFTDNNDGTPAHLSLTYSGDVTGYRVYIAVGDGTLSVLASELYAGSGGTGTLEFADYAIGADIDITGLTATSEPGTQISAVLAKSSDGSDATVVRTVSVSGLDFTAPLFSSAEVGNIDADTVRVTHDSVLRGSTVAGDWTLTGNTITAVSFTPGNTYVDLTLGTTALSTDVYTGDLAFSGSNLTDNDGNDLASYSSRDVTNNVSAGGAGQTMTILDQDLTANSGSAQATKTFEGVDMSGHDDSTDVYVFVTLFSCAGTVTAATLDGNAQAAIELNQDNATGRPLCAVIRFAGTTFADTSEFTVTTDATPLDGGVVVAMPSLAVGAVNLIAEVLGTSANSSQVDLSGNVAEGSAVVAFSLNDNGGVNTAEVGVTQVADFNVRSGDIMYLGQADDVAAATPRTITIDQTSSVRTAAMAVEFTDGS